MSELSETGYSRDAEQRLRERAEWPVVEPDWELILGGSYGRLMGVEPGANGERLRHWYTAEHDDVTLTERVDVQELVVKSLSKLLIFNRAYQHVSALRFERWLITPHEEVTRQVVYRAPTETNERAFAGAPIRKVQDQTALDRLYGFLNVEGATADPFYDGRRLAYHTAYVAEPTINELPGQPAQPLHPGPGDPVAQHD